MSKFKCYRHILLTLLCFSVAQSAKNDERLIKSKHIRKKQNVESRNLEEDNDLICETIYRIEVEPDPKNSSNGFNKCEYLCATTGVLNGKKDQFMFCLNGLSEKMKTDQDMNFPRGKSSMIIENGNQYRDNDSFTISLPSDVSINIFEKNEDDGKRRKLLQTTPFPFIGDKDTLVIRVEGAQIGEEVTASKEQLSSFIFGDNNDLLNLKSGYAACSDNQLNILKATDTGNLIDDGTLEVKLTVSTTNYFNNFSGSSLENIISDAAKSVLGLGVGGLIEDYFDFVLMCLPPNTGLPTAYAYLNWKRSVYNDNWCTFPTGLMHEIGHNIGLRHSNENNFEYDDQSCTMGYSYQGDHEGPKMCFNGGKSWVLGWYMDKSLSVDLDPSSNPTWGGKLIGVTDYSTGGVSEYKVVVEVVTGNPNDTTSQNYYILYNRKDGINSGVPEHGDRVTITQAYFSQSATSLIENQQSDQIAQLSVGDTYEISNFKSSGLNLIIKYCELNAINNPEYARISIYFSNNSDQCNAADPTSIPSASPSSEPINQASAVPSSAPSKAQSSGPTNQASPVPSAAPSSQPISGSSSEPSNSQSSGPTNQASPVPSAAPSSQPSDQATSTPSTSPSTQPSDQATSTPSAAPSAALSSSPSTGPSSSSSPTLDPGRCPSGKFAFDLKLKTDLFGYETRWTIRSESTGSKVAKSTPPLRSSTLYEHDYCFDDGCYVFEIKDSWRDGICCAYGDGFYEGYLYGDTNGEPEFTGGEFTSSQTHRFCGTGSPSPPLSNPSMSPSQSPTDQTCASDETKIEINLLTDRFPRETSFTLVGPGNNLIYDEKTFEKNTQYSYDGCYPVGCYEFTIEDSYGDGICCRYGQGNFEVLSDDEIVLEGKKFGRSASKRFCSCGEGKAFELILDPDIYPSETSWELKAADNSVILSGNAAGDQGCLSEGCYTFYIYDSYGDGICCRYGRGSYEVFYDGESIKSGGRFGASESVSFGSCSNFASAATATPQIMDSSYEKNENGEEVNKDEPEGDATGCLLRGISRLFQ